MIILLFDVRSRTLDISQSELRAVAHRPTRDPAPRCRRAELARLDLLLSRSRPRSTAAVASNGTHRMPSPSPSTRSPGSITMPSIATGTLISPGPSLYGPAMRDARGEHRESRSARISSASRIAPSITMPAMPRALRVRRHDLADDRVGEIAAGIHDDHVARLGEVERLVHHQVVAGPRLHGERRARHAPAAVHRPQARAARRSCDTSSR